MVDILGNGPLPVEVSTTNYEETGTIIEKLGCKIELRIETNNQPFVTDNGNQIIDVVNLNFDVPYETEIRLNRIPGVVDNGIFASRKADKVISANSKEARAL